MSLTEGEGGILLLFFMCGSPSVSAFLHGVLLCARYFMDGLEPSYGFTIRYDEDL